MDGKEPWVVRLYDLKSLKPLLFSLYTPDNHLYVVGKHRTDGFQSLLEPELETTGDLSKTYSVQPHTIGPRGKDCYRSDRSNRSFT